MGQALQVPATVFCFLGGRRTILFQYSRSVDPQNAPG